MSLFGKSFQEKVTEAVNTLRARTPGLRALSATVEGETVTLEGEADSLAVKSQVMQEFGKLVETANTINKIRIPAPAVTRSVNETIPVGVPSPVAAAAGGAQTVDVAAPAVAERIHVVVSGDTLGHIAQHYYGKASLYMKIFEANKDQLTDPNKIQVGQKLRIP